MPSRHALERLPVLLFALAFAALSAAAQAPGTSAPPEASGLLKAEYRPGETLRYAFTGEVKLKPWVNPAFRDAATGVPPARDYRVAGRLVVEFAPEASAEANEATLRFEGLELTGEPGRDVPAELQTFYRRVEQSRYRVIIGEHRVEFPGAKSYAAGSPLQDWLFLLLVARGLLATGVSDRPVAPGDSWEEMPPPPEEAKTGVRPRLPTANHYVGDVTIGGRACAHLRSLGTVPEKTELGPPPTSAEMQRMGIGAKRLIEGEGYATVLFDLEGRRRVFARETERSEVRYVVEQQDPDAPVRMPITVIRANTTATYTARLLPEGAPPEWEADLAAFEKSLEAPAAAETATPAAPVSPALAATVPARPAGEPSLGDLARQLREQRQAGQQPRAAQVVERAEELEKPPAGFVRILHPRGGYSVLVPTGAREIAPETFGALGVVLLVDQSEGGGSAQFALSPAVPVPSIAGADLQKIFDGMEEGYFLGYSEARPFNRQESTIDGKPARVVEFKAGQRPAAMRGIVALVVAPRIMLDVACQAPERVYPQVEATCRTVLDSIRVR